MSFDRDVPLDYGVENMYKPRRLEHAAYRGIGGSVLKLIRTTCTFKGTIDGPFHSIAAVSVEDGIPVGGSVVISGNPETLRAFANAVRQVADCNQAGLLAESCPSNIGAHAELKPSNHIMEGCAEIVISRLDARADGKLDWCIPWGDGLLFEGARIVHDGSLRGLRSG